MARFSAGIEVSCGDIYISTNKTSKTIVMPFVCATGYWKYISRIYIYFGILNNIKKIKEVFDKLRSNLFEADALLYCLLILTKHADSLIYLFPESSKITCAHADRKCLDS